MVIPDALEQLGRCEALSIRSKLSYSIMQELSHEILVGEGAERFAREIGAIISKMKRKHL